MHLEIVYIASTILEKRFGLKHRVTLISSNFLKLSFQKFHVVFDFCGVSSCQALFSIGNLCMIMRPTKMNGTKRPNASWTELKNDNKPRHIRSLSFTAILKLNVSLSMFHWTPSTLSMGSFLKFESASLTPILLWFSWRDFKTLVLFLRNLASLDPPSLYISVTALIWLIVDWISDFDSSRSST